MQRCRQVSTASPSCPGVVPRCIGGSTAHRCVDGWSLQGTAATSRRALPGSISATVGAGRFDGRARLRIAMLHPQSFLVVMVASLASAQATHVVGAGGFPDIDAALAVASAGDLVLVQPGVYPGFQAMIGVTIRSNGAGVVQIANTSTLRCAAGERMHLVDLALTNVIVNGGVITLDRCTMHQGFGGPALQITGARLHLQGCTVGGGFQTFFLGSGLVANQSYVTAIDSTFHGSHANTQIWWTVGSAGIELATSTLHGSLLTITGGNGFQFTATPPGNALRATNSTVFI